MIGRARNRSMGEADVRGPCGGLNHHEVHLLPDWSLLSCRTDTMT
jgi:hypothetical protein